jgi:alpha-1,2-mannosyltransferase
MIAPSGFTAPRSGPRRDRRRAVVLWAGFGVIAAVSSLLVLHRPAGQRLSDLHIYYGAAHAVRAGEPLYGYVAENSGPFTYPPFAVLSFQPMTLLPEGAVQVLWLLLTCGAVAAIAVALGRAGIVALERRRVAVAAIACGVLLSAPAQSNLRFGQVSILIVLLALVDGVGLTPRPVRGVLVGVAGAIKLTPLLFIVYFLLTGRYRDAGRAVAGFVACAAIGFAVLPGDSWQYWTGTMLETSRIGDLASMGNQSVHGMLLRAGVAPGTLPVVWAGLVAAVCGAALLRARHLHRHDHPVRATVLVGCATIAASPVSWTHHQVWTVLAAMVLIAANGPLRRIAGVALLAVMTVSLGVLLGSVSTYRGWQFALENGRAIGAALVCLCGFGGLVGITTAAVSVRRSGQARVWLRAATGCAALLASIALLPLPAGADPTFKAYTAADLTNPRYFYFAGPLPPETPIIFRVRLEKTKVRVNGVVDPAVARLRFYSAPGGAARDIPLLPGATGGRIFSFRSANLAQGRLVAIDGDGRVLATFSEELDR